MTRHLVASVLRAAALAVGGACSSGDGVPNAWTPSMFADANLTTLTTFGMLVKSWLAATANSDWVQ